MMSNKMTEKLHVVDIRPDREPALVFIHGRCLSHKIWERQLSDEALSAYRLIAYDLAGHGLSPRSANPMRDYSLSGYIEHLVELIEERGVSNFILVGCSLGGHIAIEALPRLPGCVGVLAVTMPLTKPVDFGTVYHPAELLGRVYKEQPLTADVKAYNRLLVSPQSTEAPLFLEEDFKKTDFLAHQALIQGIISGDYADETGIIKESKAPVAIVLGADEQIHNLAYLDSLNLPLWQEFIIKIPCGGHLVHWEQPEPFNRKLAEFAHYCTS